MYNTEKNFNEISLNLVVKSIAESIAFYQKLGFVLLDTDSSRYYVSGKMKFSETSEFTLCLHQRLTNSESGPQLKGSWVELITAETDESSNFENILETFLERGVRFTNIPKGQEDKMIPIVGMMEDPDDNQWQLVDGFEYD